MPGKCHWHPIKTSLGQVGSVWEFWEAREPSSIVTYGMERERRERREGWNNEGGVTCHIGRGCPIKTSLGQGVSVWVFFAARELCSIAKDESQRQWHFWFVSAHACPTSTAAPSLSLSCPWPSRGQKQDNHHSISLNCSVRSQEGPDCEKNNIGRKDVNIYRYIHLSWKITGNVLIM